MGLSLLDIPETFIPAEEAVCSYESQGDVEFSAGDFDDALVEYLKAEECGGDRERLEIKMSIGRFNLGLHHLKSNMYQEAAEEFLRVTACPSLVAKARAKVRMIERMIGT
jgi:tetratricopeptide (TPR) repeat protein